MQIRLILLDFDGTLVDTRHANAMGYVATMREAGYALSEEEYLENYFGMRCDEFLRKFDIEDAAERDRLRRRKTELYPTFFDSVRLNEPLWRFCCQFREQGGRVWIVSTGGSDNIRNVMRHLGIGEPSSSDGESPLGRVDGVLAGQDVTHGKPSPECFLEVMRREGCTPAETLIFEDSKFGLEAAERSGAAYFKVNFECLEF